MEEIKKVNRRIGKLRVERGLTQDHLAEKLQIDTRVYRRFEAYRNLTLRNLIRVTAALDCDLSDLFQKPKFNGKGLGAQKKKIID